jgi:post-segregation antitoxin (ccd killing protein)
MTLVNDIRKTVTDSTPVYAAVGATDLAVEMMRDARARLMATHVELDVSALQEKAITKAVKRAEQAREQAQQMPAMALNQTLEVAGKASQTYAELAVRGEKLVLRLRNQKSAKDLFAQAGSTVSLGKGAVTTVRKAAVDTQRAAKATLTTGRHEAEVVIEAVVASVQHEARATTGTVRKSAAATRTAVKRTATTAKNGTKSARRATKSVATSTTRTATAAAEAAKTITPAELPKSVTPAAAPKATTTRSTTPKVATPKVDTPKVATAKPATPKAATPKPATPKAATPTVGD